MSMRIELDFAHGLAEPVVVEAPDGTFTLSLVRTIERVDIRLSRPSLMALKCALKRALPENGRC
ncbi:MAG: hypothetical protein HY726_00650 [Candidatus Rokubacteria bacterium]|nr:hypothetical protein [Candidatus Rokubacteria bacterium]